VKKRTSDMASIDTVYYHHPEGKHLQVY